MSVPVVIDQPLANGVIALVNRDTAAVLGHVREVRCGVWHGAVNGQPAKAFRNRPAAERWVISVATAPGPWERALARALAEGIDPIAVVGLDGTFVCESSSRPGVGYLVSVTSCNCPAGEAGKPCKHIASVRACLGLPVVPDPEPAPTGPACRACGGSGTIHHARLDAQRGPWQCPACAGAGQQAA